MFELNKKLNPYEPANIFEPDHLLAILGTVLFFVGVPIAAFLAKNQVPAFSGGQTVIGSGRNVLGATSEQYVRALVTTANNQDHPIISGDKVVWYDYRAGNSQKPDIYLYDLATNAERKITSSPVGISATTSISGNRIVWSDDHGTYGADQDIYLYDLSNSTQTQITSLPSRQTEPSISGNKIVWADNRNGNWDIYFYDLSTGQERQITNNLADQTWPKISGDKIVWQDQRNGNWDIYMYDLSTSTERQITTDQLDQNFPDISGNNIVWQDARGNYDIYMYSLSTNTEKVVAGTAQSQFAPKIDGNKIAWQDWRNGSGDVYEYDLSTGLETRITYDSANQGRVDISGERIVWTDWRNGADNEDIYIYDPPPPPVPPTPPTPPPFKKVDICHRTASGSFQRITVADQAAYNGHLAHSGDIIPATEGCRPPTIKDVSLPDVFRQPGSDTTDLSKIADPYKVENLVLDTKTCNIKFKESVDLSSADVVEKFKKLNQFVLADKVGIITIDSKALPALNKKASLTMKNLTYTQTPKVLVDGKENSKVVSNIKYSKGTLTFDVSHFTTFATAPSLVISEPASNFKTSNSRITLSGSIYDPTATVSASLNGRGLGKLKVATASGKFSSQLDLEAGLNKIIVSAFSINGATASATISGTLVAKSNFLPIYALILILVLAVAAAVVLTVKRMRKRVDQQSPSTPVSNQ